MIDPAKEIERRVKALCNHVNTQLQNHYKKVKQKDKAQMISTSMSRNKKAFSRTPEQQAQSVLSGRSWTCNSGHMGDGARHVLVMYGKNATWNLADLRRKDKKAYKVFVTAFQTAMTNQKLRNFGGGKTALPAGDSLHLELPNSRLKDTDKRVTRCLQTYADATRLRGKPKNNAYEKTKGSAYQKNWLKKYDAALAKKRTK